MLDNLISFLELTSCYETLHPFYLYVGNFHFDLSLDPFFDFFFVFFFDSSLD